MKASSPVVTKPPRVKFAVCESIVYLDVEPVFVDESWALLQFDNIALALVLPSQHPPHIAVERDDTKSHGTLTPHRDGTESVYVEDPWGNTIEIMKPVCQG